MVGRWVISNFQPEVDVKGHLCLPFMTSKGQQTVALKSPSFYHSIEGESKIIYQVKSRIKEVTDYFSDKVWIILKSTIYSHTNQNTG